MRGVLKLECIGDDQAALFRAIGLRGGNQPWVARLVSYDPDNGRFTREFLRGQKDYSQANSKGSRGVYLYFWLESGSVYDVFERVTWARSKRWFAAVQEDGTVVQVEKEDAIVCLC